jgi:hypothetical protein
VDGETNTPNVSLEQATFSGQLQGQSTDAAVSAENAEIAKLHRRNRFYQALWIAAAIALLLLFTTAVILIWRNRSQVSQFANPAERYKPVSFNLGSQPLAQAQQGVLAVNGDITATGTITAANLQGNGSGITNLQANNISGVLQPSQLDPFIAYTNKNFQAFTGTNQIFRNSSNSVSAFSVQNASAAPVLSVSTATNFVGVNTSVPSISALSLEVNGAAKVDNYLLVGAQSTPNTSILDTGPLFSNDDIQRILSVQQISTNNPNPGSIFVGTANELLANPQYAPVILGSILGFRTVAGGNKNIYAGGYSALQTDKDNSKDFYLNGGVMNAVTHAGSGTVFMQAAQLNTVSNFGSGDIAYAFGSATIPITYNGGSLNGVIDYYSGNTIVDPQDPSLAFLGFPTLYEPNTISHQVGIDIQYQQSGSVGSANLVSEGYNSNNYFEGKVSIGACANNLTPSSVLGTFFCLAAPPGGTKLTINPKTSFVDDSNASLIVHSAATTDKPLVVQGITGQTGDLTQWQTGGGLAGTVVSRVDKDGNFNIGAGSPTNRLSVVDTSDDTPANFTGTSGTCTVDTGLGSLSCVSDEKLKQNILSINGGLDKIMELRGVTYNWKASPDGQAVAGFIAQEVEKVLPGLVSQLPDGTKTLSKDGLIPYLVSAVQEQQKQIDTLKNSATGTSMDALKQLADSKAVEFGGDVTIGGNIIIKGIVSGNANTRGTVVIPAGQKSGGYSFSTSYSKTPNIVVSPSSDTGGRYWLKSKSASGFTIELESAQTTDTKFDWQAQE